MENLKFYVDQNAPKTRFDHYWEKCVGSCHAYTALREDYRMMLRKAKKDLGFQYVRFHGIFNDQMSVVREVEPGKYEYNFVNIDNILDFLLSIEKCLLFLIFPSFFYIDEKGPVHNRPDPY